MKKGKGLYSVSGFIVSVLLLEVVAVLEVLDLFYQADNHKPFFIALGVSQVVVAILLLIIYTSPAVKKPKDKAIDDEYKIDQSEFEIDKAQFESEEKGSE